VLSVVVPTYRKKARLRLMLTSLICLSREVSSEVEIIVVDDGGEDDLGVVVEQAQAVNSETVVRVVKGEHGGRSVARNLGAKHASYERVLFLDDDVLLTPGVLEEHLGYGRQQCPEFVRGTILNFPWLVAFEDPESGALTERATSSLGLNRGANAAALRTRTITLDEKGRVDARISSLAKMSRFEKDLHEWLSARPLGMSGRWIGATGAHLSVDRSAMAKLGGFDEAMGLRWGAEDLEFGYRAERAGIPILHAKEAVVYHMDHDPYGREGDHQAAFEYFARKHGNVTLLKVLSYFSDQCSLSEALTG
jgi:GT2 family glycosyltransferase